MNLMRFFFNPWFLWLGDADHSVYTLPTHASTAVFSPLHCFAYSCTSFCLSGLSLDCSSCLSLDMRIQWSSHLEDSGNTNLTNSMPAPSSLICFSSLYRRADHCLFLSIFPVHSTCSTNIHIFVIYGQVGIPKLPAFLSPCWINSPQTKICIHRTLGL